MESRERMEASEHAGASYEGNGVPSLQRIDLDRVTRMVREGSHSNGFNRLHLMVGTIMPRLVGRERP